MDVFRKEYRRASLFCGLTVFALLCMTLPASAQDETVVTAVVVSSSRNTLTVRSGTGSFQLFVFAENARKPASLPVGAQVRVTSSAGAEPGLRMASEVTILEAPSAGQGTSTTVTIPPDVRRLERDIERQVRRFQVGVRAGVALDPELILLGAQAQIGPFFRSGVFFRPNVEFGFGEVTALFALNPEVIYRLPISAQEGRWSTYIGAGPAVNFIHQNFDREEGGSRIDFGDFHSDVALNILGGVRYRSGMFMELKTSVYSNPSPTLRLVVGYTF